MKKQSRILIVTVLVFVVLAVIFVACDSDGSKEATRKAREIAQKSEYYISLDENEKKKFDDELNEIIDSEYFKSLDENEKSELVGRFVESEKTIKEIANAPKDKNPEDFDVAIAQKQTEFENAKNETQALKDSGALDDEIAKAEEKQRQAETRLEAVKQERTYWEIIKTVKEAVSTNGIFEARNPNTTIRRVNGLYVYASNVIFNADFIIKSIIDGRLYFSQRNQTMCSLDNLATGEETNEEIMQMFLDETVAISVDKTCINKNSEEQKKYFEENKKTMNRIFDILERNNYTLSVIESWETTEYSYPEYIVKAKCQDDEIWYMTTYSSELNKYRVLSIQRICPEFWAQLEIERAKSNSNV